MTDQKRMIYAYLALAIGVICLGWSAIFVKFADAPGPVSAFYRFVFAGAIMIPWWLIRRSKLPARRDLLLICLAGAFFAGDLALWNTSLLITNVATSTLLVAGAPLWVGLALLIIFKQKLSIYYWIGLAVALGGMVVLLGSEALRGLTIAGASVTRGNLIALGGSFCYAAYIVTLQRARLRVDSYTFMTFSIASAVVVLLVANLIMGTQLTGYTAATYGWLVALGLITHLTGWLAINYAMGHLPHGPASVGLLGQSVVTALLAMPLLGQYLSAFQIIGGLLVLTGIFLVNMKRKQQKIEAESEVTSG
jgi:drug/metabolite transporter (DMT)-like permease